MHDISTLIRRWRDGDQRAAEALYNHHLASTFRLAYGLLGEARDAEEATQDEQLVYKSYKDLALYYQRTDRWQEAMAAAQEALSRAPSEERVALQGLIAELEKRGVKPESVVPDGTTRPSLPNDPVNLDFEAQSSSQ